MLPTTKQLQFNWRFAPQSHRRLADSAFDSSQSLRLPPCTQDDLVWFFGALAAFHASTHVESVLKRFSRPTCEQVGG